MFKTFALACLASVAASQGQAPERDFLQWAAQQGKSYSNADEFNMRQNIWAQSKVAVDGLNANPNTKAKFSLNFSADLTEREFSDFLGVLPPRNNRVLNDTDAEILVESEDRRSLEAPSGQINWASAGKLTAVKNQGSCGSCVAFAVSTVVEGMKAIKDNAAPVRLSEQHLVDCAVDYGNYGCGGGWTDRYYDFVVAEGCQPSTTYRAYNAQDGTCEHNAASVSVKGTAYDEHNGYDKAGTISRLQEGPMVIYVIAGNNTFRYYSGGIMTTDDRCPTNRWSDHAISIIGYGADEVTTVTGGTSTTTCKLATPEESSSGTCSTSGEEFSKKQGGQCCLTTTTGGTTITTYDEYWIVQNSWGTKWGESGYGKFQVVSGAGICGMNEAFFPITVA